MPSGIACDGDFHASLLQRARHDRSHADAAGESPGHRTLRAVPQARADESGRLDQGPHRRLDDRGGGTARDDPPRRHAGRGDRRQHRHRSRARRGAEGLQTNPGATRQDEPGEDLQSARDGCRGRADALRRLARSPGVLPGCRRADRARARCLLRQPVRQSRQSAGAREAPLRRRSGSRCSSASMRSW